MPALNLNLRIRNDPSSLNSTSPSELLQTTFEGIAAFTACIALAFTLWKFRDRYRAHYHRRRRRERSFELEAQLPEVCLVMSRFYSESLIRGFCTGVGCTFGSMTDAKTIPFLR
jgi:hypothetical protein